MAPFPNTLGLLFSIVQMVLYLIYRKAKRQEPMKLQELNDVHIAELNTTVPSEPNHVTASGTVTEI
ncbi:hypothetical protein CR513_59944, partial [Mucuna pruriens]